MTWSKGRTACIVFSSIQNSPFVFLAAPATELCNACCIQAITPHTLLPSQQNIEINPAPVVGHVPANGHGGHVSWICMRMQCETFPWFHLHLHVCTSCRGVETSKTWTQLYIWRLPEMEVPQNRWFLMKNPI